MRKTRAPGSRRAPRSCPRCARPARTPPSRSPDRRPLAARADAPTRLIRPRRRRWPALAAGLLLLVAAGVGGALLASAVDPSRTAATSRSVAHDHPEHHRRPAPDQDGPGDDHARGRPAAHPGKRERPEHSRLQAHAPGRLHRRTAASPPSSHRAHGPGNQVTAYANFNLGQTLVRLGQCDAALPFLRRAEQLETSRPEVRVALVYAERCASTRPAPSPSSGDSGSGSGHRQDGQDEGNQQDSGS